MILDLERLESALVGSTDERLYVVMHVVPHIADVMRNAAIQIQHHIVKRIQTRLAIHVASQNGIPILEETTIDCILNNNKKSSLGLGMSFPFK